LFTGEAEGNRGSKEILQWSDVFCPLSNHRLRITAPTTAAVLQAGKEIAKRVQAGSGIIVLEDVYANPSNSHKDRASSLGRQDGHEGLHPRTWLLGSLVINRTYRPEGPHLSPE
jgi:hypothetical protein